MRRLLNPNVRNFLFGTSLPPTIIIHAPLLGRLHLETRCLILLIVLNRGKEKTFIPACPRYLSIRTFSACPRLKAARTSPRHSQPRNGAVSHCHAYHVELKSRRARQKEKKEKNHSIANFTNGLCVDSNVTGRLHARHVLEVPLCNHVSIWAAVPRQRLVAMRLPEPPKLMLAFRGSRKWSLK